MKLLTAFLFTLLSLVLSASLPSEEIAYARLLSLIDGIEKRDLSPDNSTIVMFSASASISEKLAHVSSLVDSGAHIQKLYDISNTPSGNGVVGYIATFAQAYFQKVQESDVVDTVTADTIVYAQGHLEKRQDLYNTLSNQPWHLARISHKDNPRGTSNADKYSYIQHTTFPTNIYILDSGIRTSHQAFGGRARWGANFADNTDQDLGGHGTAVASMAAAVSLESTIYGVKVLQQGSGALSWIVAGLEWSINHATQDGKKAIFNMSLGSGAVDIYDSFMAIAQQRGFVMSIAAGNSDEDACNISPAKSSKNNQGVYTIGSTGDTDVLSGFSNWGDCVTLLAPGEAIKGASKDSDDGYAYWTGTSMSAPVFAGLAAYWMSITTADYPNLEYMVTRNTDKVTGMKGATPNILAWNLHT